MELMALPSFPGLCPLKSLHPEQSKSWRLVCGRHRPWYGVKGNLSKLDAARVRLRTNRSLHVCLTLSSAVPFSGSRREQLDFLSYGSGSDEDRDEDEPESQLSSCAVEGDALRMLEWPAVCLQVAEFASTSMGISVASSGKLIIGRSQQESEDLLIQTAAALSLSSPLDFSGIEDVREIISDAVSGNVCRCQDLCRVKGFLSAARHLHSSLEAEYRLQPKALFPLQAAVAGINLCTSLEEDINLCIDCNFSTVLDQASPSLAAARLKRQQNIKSLESKLKEAATKIVEAGGMDTALVTKRKARLCVAVRSSHKSLLAGGIVLDVSNTGATLFMEPEFAVSLNNEEMWLSAVEEAEVKAVLQRLTLKLIENSGYILDSLERILVLDLACARAAHAKWLQAVQPVFSDVVDRVIPGSQNKQGSNQSRGDAQPFTIEMFGVRHPLLLGAALPRPLASQRRLRQRSGAEVSLSKLKSSLPVPIDILVKAGVKVVTITGPNTGGKTATLKSLGVVALMAKAGLFVPAAGRPTLPWFRTVLVDIGDDQSLQRNLSTFSGHVKRICDILDFGGGEALVLLDEVGGGTDPSEGAALATAVLRHLASSVCLTVATTHSAELRTLKNKDSRFENASVEFNIKTLSPTYRILWGVAGQSNALNIAATLKFDSDVIERARALVSKLAPSKLGVRTSEVMQQLAKQLEEQCQLTKAAEDVLLKDRLAYNQLLSKMKELVEQESALQRSEAASINGKIMDGKKRMDNIVLRYQESYRGSRSENALSMREAQTAIAEIAAELAADFDSSTFGDVPGDLKVSLSQVPPVGAWVLLRRLGNVSATVVKSSPGSSTITVQLGSMKLSVPASEVFCAANTQASTPGKDQKPMRQLDGRRPSDQRASKEELPLKFEAAVQTSRNTLDLRGMRVDDAERELNLALSSRAPLSVLFVIHGIGTGVVKEAVWRTLRKHPSVAKFEEESFQNGGCTVVYIK